MTGRLCERTVMERHQAVVYFPRRTEGAEKAAPGKPAVLMLLYFPNCFLADVHHNLREMKSSYR